MIGIHGCFGWVALHWQPADEPPPPPPPAAEMIDLAPLPVALPSPPTEIAPGPKQEIAEATPPPPPPAIQPVLPLMPPTPAPRVEVPLPPAPPKPVAKAAPQLPKPKPKVKPKPAKADPVVQPPKLVPDDKQPPALATTAPPALPAPPAKAVAAPSTGASAAPPSNAVPTWQGLLLGRLEQFKRYPRSAQSRHQQGIAYLRFTMDRAGKVVSASIDKSSGFDLLDQETLALIRRAEPLPVPPSEVPGDPIELVVPVQFFLR
jgi:protein TonB